MQQILIEPDPSPMKLEVLGVDDWPTTTQQPGKEQHHYKQTETSYILSGAGHIETQDGNQIHFNIGDLVVIMPQTTCTWHITEAIQRHYSKG